MSVEFETPRFPPAPSPTALLGAASPLWGFFAGAALSGMTFWWMTRLANPQNLEAFFSKAAALPEQAAASVETAVAAQAPVIETLVTPGLPDFVVGGEAAPITPTIDALSAANEGGAKIVTDAAEAMESMADGVQAAVEPTMEALTAEPLTSDVMAPAVTAPAEPRSVTPKIKPAAAAESKPL
jgi:hypothetical protein